MFDVFTEEIEVQIKLGISNLYWYKEDLKKAWLRSGVDDNLSRRLFNTMHPEGRQLTKRELMDLLYKKLREADYNKRVEISRNFVRILIEHENFVPYDEKHRIEIAERCALKLKDILAAQRKKIDEGNFRKYKTQSNKKTDYFSDLAKVKERFLKSEGMEVHERGLEFQKIFNDLMKVSQIDVEKAYNIVGEQIDGAIKFDGHYYLVELKYAKKKTGQREISDLYFKIEGKMGARGIFISMNGYSEEMLKSLPYGKEIKVLLFDGVHIANVLDGCYTFSELLKFAIKEASLKANIFCSHNLE